jgi:hypothetical protein
MSVSHGLLLIARVPLLRRAGLAGPVWGAHPPRRDAAHLASVTTAAAGRADLILTSIRM